MTELGRSEWSEALQDHFDLRQRVPLYLAGDVLPVALIADLTDHPHIPFIECAGGTEALAGGAGTYSQFGILLDAAVNPAIRLVVDSITVQTGGTSDVVMGWEKAGNLRSTLANEFIARDCNATDEGARAPTPGRFRRGTVAAPLIPEGSRLWHHLCLQNEVYEIPGPFTIRPALGLLIEGRTAATGFRCSWRGRIYG